MLKIPTDAATSPSTAMYDVSTDCATENSPKKEAQIAQIKNTAITVPSVQGFIYIFSLVFNELSISLSNGSDTCLYNNTGDIIHVFVHGVGFFIHSFPLNLLKIPTDAATSPSTAMYGISTDCATETSPKKEAQIAQIKTTAITVPSV